MEFTREDLVMCTIISQLNKAVEKGYLKLPGSKQPAKAANIKVHVPSNHSDNDSDTEAVSSLPTPGDEFLQGGLVFKKSVKMVISILFLEQYWQITCPEKRNLRENCQETNFSTKESRMLLEDR